MSAGYVRNRFSMEHTGYRQGSNVALLFLVALIMLSPTIFAPLRLDDLVVVVGLSLYMMRSNVTLTIPLLLIGLLLILSFLLSLGSGEIITDNPVILRDVLFVGLIVKYFIFFFLIRSTNIVSTITAQRFMKCIAWLGIVSGVVAVLQYCNLFGVNNWLTPHYMQQEFYLNFLKTESPARRVIGTSFNPNHYAFLLSFSLISAFVLGMIYTKIKYTLVCILLFIPLVMTLSRTGIILNIFTLSCLFVLWKIKQRKYVSIVIVGCCVGVVSCLLFSVAYLENDIALFERFSSGELNLSGNNSIGVRVRRWMDLLTWLSYNPSAWLFGVGPQKANIQNHIYIDSQYAGLLKKTGLAGMLLVLGVELTVLFSAIKVYLRSRTYEQLAISLLVIGTIISLGIIQITAEIMTDTQNIGLLMVIWGVFYHKQKLEREKSVI